ncbi:MAG: chorismate mutase [Clostridiales bacterium]|nr:chorismate mutase [Clostridiales bacterium]
MTEFRKRIDEIDKNIVSLFLERMEVSSQIAGYKREHNLPIFDRAREEAKLENVSSMSTPELREYTKRLYRCLFELSRDYQSELLAGEKER